MTPDSISEALRSSVFWDAEAPISGEVREQNVTAPGAM